MKFDQTVQTYLRGDEFSSTIKVPIAVSGPANPSSIRYLCDQVADKRVIHLGCADHYEMIDNVMAKGKWLHATLAESAQECVGVDINKKTLDYIVENYGIEGLHCADITVDDLDFLGDEMWDLALLPDILEHIPDLHSFLASLQKQLQNRCEQVLITVPNALCFRNMKTAYFRGLEKINTDHRYWFTPYTMGKALTDAGFDPAGMEFHYTTRGLGKRRVLDRLGRKLFWRQNHFSDTLVMICQVG